ncbi:MAG: hypothetical protein Kow0032_28580 [Methyloligellaceae bacterium]
MRKLVACFLCVIVLLAQSSPSHAFRNGFEMAFESQEALLEWLYTYRKKPSSYRLPAAVHAMKRFGLLRDSEKADFFVGFIAGVLSKNPRDAYKLATRMFPMPPKEQAVIIRAVAYSGLPDWPEILEKLAPRMPHRQALLESHVMGEEPTLMDVPLESGPAVIYALWGFYVATGDYAPVGRIIRALRWAKGSVDKQESAFMRRVRAAFTWSDGDDDVNKATIGGTAKWTLVSHAERDRELIDVYRVQVTFQDAVVAQRLREVIEASEKFESERIRKEELAAIERIRRANPEGAGFNRATSLGSVAIATGCVAASAAGMAQIGVPCIVSGAVYSGFVKLLRQAGP